MFGAGYTGQWFCKAIRELDEGRGGAGGERRSAVRISASTRSREQAEGLEASGLVDDAHAFDLDEAYLGLDAAGQAALRSATHVLVTVPPVADRDRDPLLALHGDLLRSSARLRWVGYLSTTGVYGNHDGAWVDESSQTLKGVGEGRPAIRARLAAEREWLQQERTVAEEAEEAEREDEESGFGRRLPVQVFRLAGIYGPGRSALDTVRKGVLKQQQLRQVRDGSKEGNIKSDGGGVGQPLPVPPVPAEQPPPAGDSAAAKEGPVQWVSRIHVEDICGALLASTEARTTTATTATTTTGATEGTRQQVFNLGDDRPAPRQEVLAFAASLLLSESGDGASSSEGDAAAVEAFLADNAASNGAAARDGGRLSERRLRALNKENKRVGNTRLRSDLAYDLRYPSYAEGLRAIRQRETERPL